MTLGADVSNLTTTAATKYDDYEGPDPYAVSKGLPMESAVETYTLMRVPAANQAAFVNDNDYSRQLYLKTPDQNTVVTWCFHHRPLVGGNPTPNGGSKDDIFLFLDGSTRVGSFTGALNASNCPNHTQYVNGFDDPGCQ